MRLTTSNKDVICSLLEPNSKWYRSQSCNVPPTSMWAHVKALTPTCIPTALCTACIKEQKTLNQKYRAMDKFIFLDL
jgi:hypothetical protein